MKKIIVVNEKNKILYTEEKKTVHQKGLLHRAFSVLIFNKDRQLLLQRRALTKYHCGGLWTNSCCGHPFIGKSIKECAQQRLQEEMGIKCDLKFIFKFSYHSVLSNNLIENEIDSVFIGFSDCNPNINVEEADVFKWVDLEKLYKEMERAPDSYTPWFHIIMRELKNKSLWATNS